MWSLKPDGVFCAESNENRLWIAWILPCCRSLVDVNFFSSNLQGTGGAEGAGGGSSRWGEFRQKVDEESCIHVKSMKLIEIWCYNAFGSELAWWSEHPRHLQAVCWHRSSEFDREGSSCSMKFWAWYREDQHIWELVNNAKWSACGPLTWNFCLWGVLLVICLIVPLEGYAIPLVLCIRDGCLLCRTGQIHGET